MGVMLPEGMNPPLAIVKHNVLLVHGTQEAIKLVREILAYFDKPAKQVEIATKFVEVDAIQDKPFAIDWFVSSGGAEWYNLGFAPGEGIQVARFRRGTFEKELRSLLAEGHAQIINEPFVTTPNNIPAQVCFSTELPYFYATITYNQHGQRTVEYESDTVSLSRSLIVTARILADDTIVLDLEPEIDDQFGTVVGPDGTILPIVSTQTAYVQGVRVPDGDTIVIGGLVRRHKTPGLKGASGEEMPIIGEKFLSKLAEQPNKELLIFVTPRIIREVPRE